MVGALQETCNWRTPDWECLRPSAVRFSFLSHIRRPDREEREGRERQKELKEEEEES